MGRWSIGGFAAVALLAACSPSSSDSAATLPPLLSTTAPPATTSAPVATTVAPTTPPTTTVRLDAVAISQAHGGATMRVLVDHCGTTSSGSAFAIDDRHVVTSRAVVSGDATPEVVLRDGRTITTTLIGVAADVDIAVLRAEPGTFTEAAAWGDSAGVAEGEGLTVIGYPDPGDYDVLDVSVRSVADDATAFRLDVPLDAGQGGSPAFDATGAVMGVSSPVGGSAESGVLVPATLAAGVVAGIVAAPTAPQTTCDGAVPTPSTPASTVPASTNPGDTTTSTGTTLPGTTLPGTPTTLPGPGTGQDAKGTWIMQLASARSATATPAVIAEQVAEFSKLVAGVHTLRSNDWPTAYPTPDLVVFYVGGYPSKSAVEAQCVALGLKVPDDCLARFLDG